MFAHRCVCISNEGCNFECAGIDIASQSAKLFILLLKRQVNPRDVLSGLLPWTAPRLQ